MSADQPEAVLGNVATLIPLGILSSYAGRWS